MSKPMQITLPDEDYASLEALCEKEKIRPATMATALIRKALEIMKEQD